jgi:hypothetical protein
MTKHLHISSPSLHHKSRRCRASLRWHLHQLRSAGDGASTGHYWSFSDQRHARSPTLHVKAKWRNLTVPACSVWLASHSDPPQARCQNYCQFMPPTWSQLEYKLHDALSTIQLAKLTAQYLVAANQHLTRTQKLHCPDWKPRKETPLWNTIYQHYCRLIKRKKMKTPRNKN